MLADPLVFVGRGKDRLTHGSGDPGARFHVVFPATEKEVRRVLERVEAHLGRAGLSADRRGVAELILAEALNNIVEHAYAGMQRGLIELTLWQAGEAIWLKLRDDGHPMPNLALPRSGPVDLSVPTTDLPEGGFGWPLIRNLCRDVVYERVAGRNDLTCIIDAEAPPGPQ